MTTPAKQQLIRQARRAALKARLIGDGLLPAVAEAWIERALEDSGPAEDSTWWEAQHSRILELHGRGRRPSDRLA